MRTKRNRDQGAALDDVRTPPFNPVADGISLLLRWVEQMFDEITPAPRPPVLDSVDLDEVIRYFADDHPGDPRIRAGALVRLGHPKGSQLFQVFMDGEYQICADQQERPYGRRMVVKSLGPELEEKLAAGNGVVIFR
jgi:hypothetical protein